MYVYIVRDECYNVCQISVFKPNNIKYDQQVCKPNNIKYDQQYIISSLFSVIDVKI